MGPEPPQTRKEQQSFPFQTLPHSAGNGREKGGAVRLQKFQLIKKGQPPPDFVTVLLFINIEL